MIAKHSTNFACFVVMVNNKLFFRPANHTLFDFLFDLSQLLIRNHISKFATVI